MDDAAATGPLRRRLDEHRAEISLAGLAEELTTLMGVKVDVATADILRDEIRADAIVSATAL